MALSLTLWPTVFDLYGVDRLTAWKTLREEIETLDTPLQRCAEFWKKAPYVNQYLDPLRSDTWPDPWQLILDGKYDDLAISLGMLYTLKLTDRFSRAKLEIYADSNSSAKDARFYLKVNDLGVLNMVYGEVSDINSLRELETQLIFPRQDLR